MTEKTYNDLLLKILRQKGDIPTQTFTVVTALDQPPPLPQRKSQPPPSVLAPHSIQEAINHAQQTLTGRKSQKPHHPFKPQ